MARITFGRGSLSKFLGVPENDSSKREKLGELLHRGVRILSRAGAKPTAAGSELRRGALPSLQRSLQCSPQCSPQCSVSAAEPAKHAAMTSRTAGPSVPAPTCLATPPVGPSTDPQGIAPSEARDPIQAAPDTTYSNSLSGQWTDNTSDLAQKGLIQLPNELANLVMKFMPISALDTARLIDKGHRNLVDSRYNRLATSRNTLFQVVAAIESLDPAPFTTPLVKSLMAALPDLLPDDLQVIIDALNVRPQAIYQPDVIALLASIARELGQHAEPFIRRVADAIKPAPSIALPVRAGAVAIDQVEYEGLAATRLRAGFIADFVTRYQADSSADLGDVPLPIQLEPLIEMAGDPTLVHWAASTSLPSGPPFPGRFHRPRHAWSPKPAHDN